MLDEATLGKHLKAIGWHAARFGPDTYRTVHETPEGAVDVYMRLSENWIVASVVPFLATRGEVTFELSRWLLRMNRDTLQTKFAYDEDGDVILTVELPTESLDHSELRAALEALVRDAVRFRGILRAAAK
jgi:hypothetical protein